MSLSGKMLNKTHGVEAVVRIAQKIKKVKISLKQNGKTKMMMTMMIMEVIWCLCQIFDLEYTLG